MTHTGQNVKKYYYGLKQQRVSFYYEKHKHVKIMF